jgi:hypothetical protein
MKGRNFWTGFLIAAILGFQLGIGDEGVEKKGIVTYADGQVRRMPEERQEWERAPVNTDILSGDKVRTYQKSRAELNLAELDIIRLAPRTIIDIVKLYEETKEQKARTQINLEEGEIWATVHKVEAKTEFDISAPIAAAAITGTVLRLNVAQDSTTQLKVYRGEVHITNAPERKDLKPKSLIPREVPGPYEIPGPREVTLEEWIYIVKSMEQVTIDNRGQLISKGKFSEKDEDEKSDWVLWNQQRDRVQNREH